MNKERLGPIKFFVSVAIAAIGALVATSQPAIAGSSGECVIANVTAPFRLPNGRLYPAASLTMCDSGRFSPVVNLHRISVDGSTVGLFLSRKRYAETDAVLAPEILFNRAADGNLVLVGYSVPSSGRMVAYRLRAYGETLRASSRHAKRSASATPPVAAIIAGTR